MESNSRLTPKQFYFQILFSKRNFDYANIKSHFKIEMTVLTGANVCPQHTSPLCLDNSNEIYQN